MADFYASTAMPGPSAVSITTERAFLCGPITWYLLKGGVMNGSASSDAGNTPTTELRVGLLMAQRTSDQFFANYAPNAVDGTQLAAGVLWMSIRTIDSDGLTVNRPCDIVIAGYVKASQLILLDEQARRQMQGRFIFDDRLIGLAGGYSQTVPKTANYTVVAGALNVPGDNNTHFTTTGNAGAIVFTLPAVAKGNRFRFTNTTGFSMSVTAPAGTLLTFNNAAATSITFSTAGNLIGGTIEIVADDTGTKWIAIPSGSNTVTVA